MVVHIDCKLWRNVDFKFLVFRDRCRKFFVERVYSLNHNGAVLVNSYRASFLFCALCKIEARQGDFLTVDKVEKILVELLDVKTFNMFEVNLVCRFALHFANLFAFEIVVVHGNHDGIYSS